MKSPKIISDQILQYDALIKVHRDKLSRLHGDPAIIIKARVHQEGDPAEKYSTSKFWYLCGKNCTKKMYQKLTQSSNAELLLLMGQGYDEYIEQRLKGRK